MNRSAFNAVIVVSYRSSSTSVTAAFFSDLNELLECVATYAAPLVIVGDLNIHVTRLIMPTAPDCLKLLLPVA
jgi:hypothetical protein